MSSFPPHLAISIRRKLHPATHGVWVSFITKAQYLFRAGWDTQVREHIQRGSDSILPGQPEGLRRVFRRSILVQGGHTHNEWTPFAGHGPRNLLLPPPPSCLPDPSHLLIPTYSGSEVHSQEGHSCCALCVGKKAGQRQGWTSHPFSPFPSDVSSPAHQVRGNLPSSCIPASHLPP